jgi:endonuclease/exonuclease/phosphatase family metal-dependent hydrolase
MRADAELGPLPTVLADARTYDNRPVFVVAGDFNLDASPRGAASALREAGFHDAIRLDGRPTTPPHGLPQHAHAIDWIFVSGRVDVQGRVHHDVHASDHYPVSAAFDWP